MIQRIVTALVIIAAVVPPLLFGGWLLAALVALIVLCSSSFDTLKFHLFFCTIFFVKKRMTFFCSFVRLAKDIVENSNKEKNTFFRTPRGGKRPKCSR
ncbi:MAG: hypothetical protein EOM11_01935, partial [Erysipelotrichia bacterium]|nr:hypothetical protein [Erysipelotrichia bacterium]